MQTNDRRGEPRFETDGVGSMQIVRPPIKGTLKVRVSDVSRSGLRIHMHRRIAEGSEVMIRLGESLIFAEVRNCRGKDSGEFDAGLRITNLQVRMNVKSRRERSASRRANGVSPFQDQPARRTRLAATASDPITGVGTIYGDGITEPISCVYELYTLRQRGRTATSTEVVMGMVRTHGDPWIGGTFIGKSLSLRLADNRVWPFRFVKASGQVMILADHRAAA